MVKILFMASGNGGTMKFIHQAIQSLHLDFEISAVLTDRHCGASEYSTKCNIPIYVYDKWREQTNEIISNITEIKPDIVITNIHKILPPEIFNCCNAQFINLHYSLLPAFGGVIGFKTLELAKAANTQIIGATCHFVTEEVDAGKVIAQAAIPVDWNEDFDAIGNMIFRVACEVILNGLLIITDKELEKYQKQVDIIYSPLLRYDNGVFDDEFWRIIKEL